jgi:hypothetical protein
VHVDPSGSQPPGVIYQLPLDSARKDAAPQQSSATPKQTTPRRKAAHTAPAPSGGGSGGSSGGSGGSGGSTPSGGSGGSSSGGGNGAGVANTAIHSENGLGSSSKVPGLGKSVGPTQVQRTAAETSGSTDSTVPLVALGLILFFGGAAGVAGRRMAQHWQA